MWNNKDKIWTPRKAGHTIGRTFYFHSNFEELYYLRLLLNHTKGATSYESLRTFNDVIYLTYQATCHALGLLGDDEEWNEAILEASFWSTSSQIRQLFIIILTFCNINNPIKFLEKYWNLMSDDILYRIRPIFNSLNFQILEIELYNYVLYELEKLLNLNSMTLANFNLTLPTGSLINDLNNKLLREELNYDVEKLKDENNLFVKNLNSKQLHIYEEILRTIDLEENKLFFICGHEGT